MKPEEIADGAAVELETTTGETKGVVLRNHRKDRWLKLHTGKVCDDIEYDQISAIKTYTAPTITKKPKLKRRVKK